MVKMLNEAQIYAWIEAIGTTLSAIASTPSKILSDSMLNDLNLIGNVLQAVGNGYIPEDEELLVKFGTGLQALGNIVVIQGFFAPDQETSELLNTQGNLLQTLGGGASIDFQENQTVNEALNNIGNIIQVIGNSIQVLSVKYPQNSEKYQELNTVGSWVQAIGAVLSALTVD